jgi:hypothetical protein
MREIPLSRDMVALVDDEDYADLSQFKWHANKDGNRFYVQRTMRRGGKWWAEPMHRRILNAKRGEKVDHVNHNGLDCQRENIRICTDSQNQGNRKKNINGSSRFKGVNWHKRYKVWQARIQGRYLGCFTDEELAARAYDAAAKKLFGEFALVNFQ